MIIVNTHTHERPEVVGSSIISLMQRIPFRTVLEELARTEPDRFLKKDGTVNASQMAEAIGVTQPTISRAINNPRYQPKRDLIDKLRGYFEISAAQARGEEKLGAKPNPTKMSGRAKQLALQFDSLPTAKKTLIETMIRELSVSETQRNAS